MKNIMLLLILLAPTMTEAQVLKGTIKDAAYWGVRIFEDAGFSGNHETYASDGETFTAPFDFRSVKIYGPWKLVRVGTPISIRVDDPSFNASSSGTWRVVKTDDSYSCIVYTESNYNGEATYLKGGKHQDLFDNFESLKLRGAASKVGYANASGFQKCYKDKVSNLPYPGARIDISIRYTKCASL